MKNINKNDFRNILKGVVIGGLIFGGIGVSAVTLTANQIKYTPSDENFKATNAEEALDEIYKIAEYKIPENTYFYEEGTEGDAATIVRYKKINDEYFVCDANGVVAQGTTATDVTDKKLIEYKSIASGNISAGSAGYASNSFILGDGSDNTSYMESEKKLIFDKLNSTTIQPEYLLKGYTYVDANGNIVEGTMTSITALADLPWTRHTGTTFTATTDCYVVVGVGSGCFGINASALSASISTTGQTIYYNGNKSKSLSTYGGSGAVTSGLYKLTAGQTITVSGSGSNVGWKYNIYYANLDQVKLSFNKLEDLTWQNGGTGTFTASEHCYVLVHKGGGAYSATGSGTATSSISTTTTKTIAYSGNGSGSFGQGGGSFVVSTGIYELNAGHTISHSGSAANVGSDVNIYYAILD